MPDQEKLLIGLVIFAFGYVLLGIGLGFLITAAVTFFALAVPVLAFGAYVAAPELIKMIKSQ